VFLLEASRGPFYRPKGPRSRWKSFWKAIFAFYRVAHRTVRAPPDRSCSLSGARSPSKSGSADRWSNGPLGSPGSVRCTLDSPVRQLTVGSGHASLADCAVDRWRGRPLARRTVWCTNGSATTCEISKRVELELFDLSKTLLLQNLVSCGENL
jgi:hypothetical protein